MCSSLQTPNHYSIVRTVGVPKRRVAHQTGRYQANWAQDLNATSLLKAEAATNSTMIMLFYSILCASVLAFPSPVPGTTLHPVFPADIPNPTMATNQVYSPRIVPGNQPAGSNFISNPAFVALERSQSAPLPAVGSQSNVPPSRNLVQNVDHLPPATWGGLSSSNSLSSPSSSIASRSNLQGSRTIVSQVGSPEIAPLDARSAAALTDSASGLPAVFPAQPKVLAPPGTIKGTLGAGLARVNGAFKSGLAMITPAPRVPQAPKPVKPAKSSRIVDEYGHTAGENFAWKVASGVSASAAIAGVTTLVVEASKDH